VSFFDHPLRVTRFKLVQALWRRQQMDVLPGVAPVSLLLAQTVNTVVGLTDVRRYPTGRGIPTSRIEVDGAAIRTAADTAVTLWPDDPYRGDDS
jgi:hypothetical protein